MGLHRRHETLAKESSCSRLQISWTDILRNAYNCNMPWLQVNSMGHIVLLQVWQWLELMFEWKLEKDKVEFPRHKVCSCWQI